VTDFGSKIEQMATQTSLRRNPRNISKRGQVIRISIVCLAVLGFSFYVYLPAREMAWRLTCCKNLKDYGGGKVTLGQIKCPRSHGPYLLEPIPDCCNGRSDLLVIAYEPLTNHGGEGGAILYGDGHSEFLLAVKYQAAIQNSLARVRQIIEEQAARNGN